MLATLSLSPPPRVEARVKLQLGLSLYHHSNNLLEARQTLEQAVSYLIKWAESIERAPARLIMLGVIYMCIRCYHPRIYLALMRSSLRRLVYYQEYIWNKVITVTLRRFSVVYWIPVTNIPTGTVGYCYKRQ